MTYKITEALKLAEEALERWREWDKWHSEGAWDNHDDKAIAALREALAEPNWYEEAMRLGGLNAKHVGELKQLRAEPVKQSAKEQGYVPLSNDAKSIFIDGFGEVPIDWDKYHGTAAQLQPVKQEPVAEVDTDSFGCINWLKTCPDNGTKLYAAPVSAKREWVDLTDDEIDYVYMFGGRESLGAINFARAVITAFKEKNK